MIRAMTLARMWRRQLCAASSAALIVPSAMIAALVALALGGGFSQLGVLGQVFSGPPAPSAGALAQSGAAARTTAASIPTIPAAPAVATRTLSGVAGSGARGRVAPVVPRTGVSRTGLGSTGGTIAPGGGTTRPISQAPAPPPQPRPAPVSSSPSPSPGPAPAPHPTPVDTVVKTVTSVTSQVPAPVGPAVTQAMQSAGSAADGLLSSVGSPSPGSPAP
jgi:hypothetical protein